MDKSDVIDFLNKQEAQIYNLCQLVRGLTYHRKGIANTPKETPINNLVNKVISELLNTSREEGPEGETWFTWGWDKENHERDNERSVKDIEKIIQLIREAEAI